MTPTTPSHHRSPATSRSRALHRIASLLVLLLLIASPLTPAGAAPRSQASTPAERAAQLLERLSPEEKVGQLFLVTFDGRTVEEGSEIYELIVNHHVGGVVLRADNDNFIGPEGTLAAAQTLVSDLQRTEWAGTLSQQIDPSNGLSFRPAFIPLFVAISQEGAGYPYDQILNGLTPLPNQLSIGATWRPGLARQVGTVVGRELSLLGLNMLLGPSLDVLGTTAFEGPKELGTRTFGGDPYWVGEMGQAYITGVHEGSEGVMAVVGKHFPGLGDSDRLPTEEVATVRKSLEQLKQIELAPFFAVTGDATTPEATVDALLTSHIRYKGFQGNLRATTSPISFDPQAFELVMSLPQLASWREDGGLIVSDELGSRAVRRFFESSGQEFDGRTVARNAFLAGNDLLYLGDFVGTDDPTRQNTILKTLEFFAQKYREDPAFQQRVDQSVLRILTLKFRQYEDFTLSATLPAPESLESLTPRDEIIFNVASRAATLISPAPAELDNVIPSPPELNNRIVFFTDNQIVQQCSQCPEQSVIPVDALENAVVDLYGPEAGGQILPYNLVSFSYAALTDVLNAGIGDSLIERTARSAQWIVFVMTDEDPDRPSSLALRRFLEERSDLYRQKHLIVFSFDAPLYLDATDIIKLTAYYGIYGEEPQFVDVAARLLFKELRPIPGAPPISVPGVGYFLIEETSPDPTETIQLFLDVPEAEGTGGTPDAPEPVLVGDLVPVQTGVILDHNGNPVPDGTPVRFTMTIGGVDFPEQVEFTVNGTASTTLIPGASGTMTIMARSGEPPATSNPLQLDVRSENEGTLEPGATPTATESPPPTVTPTTEVVLTEEPPDEPGPHMQTDVADWGLAILLTGALSWTAYRMGISLGQVRWGTRWGLCVLIGGLVVYTYLSLQLPGTTWLLESWGRWGVVWSTLGGALVGLGSGWGWRSLRRRASG